MKKRGIKILVFLLFLAVSVKTTSEIWFNDRVSVVLTEKEEKGNTKGAETEKEESKDKIYQFISPQQEFNYDRSFIVLNHIHFNYSAYLSLPEIPPEKG